MGVRIECCHKTGCIGSVVISVVWLYGFSLPELPSPCEVVCFTVEVDSTLGSRLAEMVEGEGCVLKHAPVQISHTVEKPGGVLVHWEQVWISSITA